MNPQRKKRLLILLGSLVLLGGAVACILLALKENLSIFYDPQSFLEGKIPPTAQVRVGGWVPKGSVRHDATGVGVVFAIKKGAYTLPVHYEGVLPDLFREGQGVVVQGHWTLAGVFEATEVLAKHDENYMPRGLVSGVEREKGVA